MPQPLFDLALEHHRAGRLADAEQIYRQILAQDPNHAAALNSLGVIRKQSGRYDEAIDLFTRSLTLSPNYFEAQNNLGNALREIGRLDEAIAALRRAAKLQPNRPEPHYNLASALRDSGQFDEAIAACRSSVQINPDSADAHWNLAIDLLRQGQFSEGWAEYEWRWRRKDFPHANRTFSQPQWTGEQFPGKTLLLHCEQGLGDSLQFVRYIPQVAQRGGNVLLVCPPELRRLFLNFPGTTQIISDGDPLPSFDLHSPLLSLPRIFNTQIHSIPNSVPYLHVDAHQCQQWKKRLVSTPKGFRVGLTWAGNPAYTHDRLRSIPFSQLAPLTKINDVIFFSLQKGQPNPGLIDFTPDLSDFADTAALISQLDLIISVDTAVVHLAGAMAKPVWVLLPYVSDWRWMTNRDDSPWYPTVRLFRQRAFGDWPAVIVRVAESLRTEIY